MSGETDEARNVVLSFSAPRTRVGRWLMRPHRALSPAVHHILLSNYFANLKALVLGGLNSVLVATVIALWLRSPGVAALAGLDALLLVLRVVVRAGCHRNAARGLPTATDLYVGMNLLWPTLQGLVTLCVFLSGDWPSILLASVSAVAVMGPLCVRNFSVPNLATLQCAVLVLPNVFAAFFVREPVLGLFAVQLPFAVLAVRGVTEQVALLAGGAFQSTLENERAALRDHLTGLGNRRAFERACRTTFAGGRSAHILCLDLDGFKPVNDRYGHPAGDAVLTVVAGRLRAAFAGAAEIFRLGGDEFAAVGSGLDGAALRALGERAITAVGEPITLPGGTQVEVGITVGAAAASAASITPGGLFEIADAALYRAKAAGKRRVEIGTPGWPPATARERRAA
ncbi:GGDEF domain-containing protein [Methylobacterium nigriterrae]|uniref:GGDEF domain-containing protein n=1 Tax=Methylobacterium nigriterrae TaxID=3127512 RepID=UPI0030137175